MSLRQKLRSMFCFHHDWKLMLIEVHSRKPCPVKLGTGLCPPTPRPRKAEIVNGKWKCECGKVLLKECYRQRWVTPR